MQAYECTAQVDASGALHLPQEITARVQTQKQVRVLVLMDEYLLPESKDHAWNTATATEFLRGYSDTDAMYDTL